MFLLVFCIGLSIFGIVGNIPITGHAIGDSNDIILRLSSESNAHGELYDEDAYSTLILYSDIFGVEYSGTDHPNCDSSNSILQLSDDTNAHAEIATQSNYDTYVCYGDLTCTYEIGSCSSGTCVVTLSDDTNAHLATCDSADAYDLKVCCTNSEIIQTGCTADTDCSGEEVCDIDTGNCVECIDSEDCDIGYTCQSNVCVEQGEPYPYWYNYETGGETTAIIDDTIFGLYVTNTGFTKGERMDLEIYEEDDGPLDFVDDLVTTVRGYSDDYGIVSTGWIPSAEDWEKGGSEAESEFYFKESIKGIESARLIITFEDEDEIELYCSTLAGLKCNEYDEEHCEADPCKVDEAQNTSEEDPTGCFYDTNNACIWEDDECKAKKIDTNERGTCPAGLPPTRGYCDIGNVVDDCSDGFLTYTTAGTWDWQENTYEDKNLVPGSDIPYYDDADGKWHWYPSSVQTRYEDCQDDSPIKVACPSYTRLPFFGIFNIILTIGIISLIYFVYKREN